MALKLDDLDPPVDAIYCSPYYRCLQTLRPWLEVQDDRKAKVERGIGEFYGRAHFDHPQAAPLSVLHKHFPGLLQHDETSLVVPDIKGETIPGLHDRVALAISRIIRKLDRDPKGPKALLICTHAAVMISLGRVLTGRMPEDVSEEDFHCATCALSIYRRRSTFLTSGISKLKEEEDGKVDWRGKGVAGGWECEVNGDCSFLKGGEERPWHFSGDEGFLNDSYGFDDTPDKGSRL